MKSIDETHIPEEIMEIYTNRKKYLKSLEKVREKILNQKATQETFYIFPRKKIPPLHTIIIGSLLIFFALEVLVFWETFSEFNLIMVIIFFLLLFFLGISSIFLFITDLILAFKDAIILNVNGFLYHKSPRKMSFVKWNNIEKIEKYYKETYTTERWYISKEIIIKPKESRDIRLNFKRYNEKYAISHEIFYKIVLNFFLLSKNKQDLNQK